MRQMQQVGADTRRTYSQRWKEQDMAKAEPPAQPPAEYDEAATLARAQAGPGDIVKVDWHDRLPAAVSQSPKIMAVVESLLTEAKEGDIQTRILEGILDAEETEQMVPGGKIPSIQDICKQDRKEESPEYMIFGFSVNESDAKEGEGLPIYLVFDAMNTATGAREVIGTGAVQTVLSFYQMRAKNRLPVVVRWFISHKETDAGWRPLNFELVDPDPLHTRRVKVERVIDLVGEPAPGSTPHESGWNAPPAS